MECEAEQTPLTAREHFRSDVQERGRRRRPRPNDLDDASLLDDEEAIGAVTCMRDEDPRRQPPVNAGTSRISANNGADQHATAAATMRCRDICRHVIRFRRWR